MQKLAFIQQLCYWTNLITLYIICTLGDGGGRLDDKQSITREILLLICCSLFVCQMPVLARLNFVTACNLVWIRYTTKSSLKVSIIELGLPL